MDFLKGILGDELYGQVEGKITGHNTGTEDKNKQIKLENINSGNYVSKEKFLTLQTETDGYKTQLGTANTEIASYKNMDIDGIKQAAANWEIKYNEDTGKLNQAILTQQKEFTAKEFLNRQGFNSELAKKAAVSEIMSLDYKDGTFTGADDLIKKLKESDPNSFVVEEDNSNQNNSWVRGTGNTYKPPVATEKDAVLKSKYGSNKYYKG